MSRRHDKSWPRRRRRIHGCRLPGVIVARWYLANNQIAAARAELEQVVATLPDEPEAYALLGELAWRDRRIAETEMLFREALARAQLLKGFAGPQGGSRGRGPRRVWRRWPKRGRQWSTARDELAAWIKLDEKNPNAHQRLGYALFHLGKPKEALAEFQAAAKLNPEFIAGDCAGQTVCRSGRSGECHASS